MDLFWKVTGGILITLILGLSIGKQEKDMALLLYMTACCMGGMTIVFLLDPVVKFVQELGELLPWKSDMLSVLLKIAGIAFVAEISERICADAGCGSLGKIVQLLGNTVILSLLIPVFRKLIGILQELLGNL